MKGFFLRLTVLLAVAGIIGCAGETKELHMQDVSGQTKTVVFPNGTVFGGASSDQASTLAEIFVDSHNQAMKELADIKAISNKNLETSQKALQMLEQLSKNQGSGEITIFFPVGSSEIKKNSPEYQRLVSFSDYLSRESRGRKVLLITIGSASAFGDRKTNEKLAQKRSEAPADIMDQYLVNIPHQFYKVYGTGDIHSPKNVTMKEHQRYQHVRIIAFYETDQVPPLPEEPLPQSRP